MNRDEADAQLAFAEEVTPHLAGKDAKKWEDRLAEHHEALSAALEFYVDANEADRAIRLVAALHRYWFSRPPR
jgi:hypothetical protein